MASAHALFCAADDDMDGLASADVLIAACSKQPWGGRKGAAASFAGALRNGGTGSGDLVTKDEFLQAAATHLSPLCAARGRFLVMIALGGMYWFRS